MLVLLPLIAALALVTGFVLFVQTLDDYRHAGDPPRAQGIVALTGGSQRVADAIDLLSRGFADRLLISGVNERTTRAQIARLNPGQKDWLECCVDLDHRARNTIGNAIETRRWVVDRGFEAIIVVTSNYHMPRTMLELDNAMPDVAKHPHAVSPADMDVSLWWRDSATFRLIGQEYLKFLMVWGRTKLENDPELSRLAAFLSRKPHSHGGIGETSGVE
ncbi:MAG: YdcF family protein [Salinarimonas sp.]|nr:YdcF family protein [Salinarimonas sp.]